MTSLEPKITPLNGGWQLSAGPFVLCVVKKKPIAQAVWLAIRERLETLLALSAVDLVVLAGYRASQVLGADKYRALGDLFGRKLELWHRLNISDNTEPDSSDLDFYTTSPGELAASLTAGFILSDAPIPIQSIEES
jgi:hypothetical protein